jgi:hypothetical protein
MFITDRTSFFYGGVQNVLACRVSRISTKDVYSEKRDTFGALLCTKINYNLS